MKIYINNPTLKGWLHGTFKMMLWNIFNHWFMRQPALETILLPEHILSNKINTHLSKNNLLASEQQGAVKNSYGTKRQLLINRSIFEDVFRKILCDSYTACVQSGKICNRIKHEYGEGSYKNYLLSCIVEGRRFRVGKGDCDQCCLSHHQFTFTYNLTILFHLSTYWTVFYVCIFIRMSTNRYIFALLVGELATKLLDK